MSTVSTTRVAIFDRVLCAFDGSSGATVAAKQGDVLRNGLGDIELVGVYETPALYSADGGPLIVADAEREFDRRFAAGRSAFPHATAEVLHGPVVPRLLDQIAEFHATLVATGATEHSRPIGALLGSVSTAMLHRAPCSVLIARRAWGGVQSHVRSWSGMTVLGKLTEALSVGRDLAAQFDATLRVVLGAEAALIEAEELDGLTVERDARHPVDALCKASESADLLLVGSRGLRGVKAMGSISEQIGHQSACSVLIVRGAPGR